MFLPAPESHAFEVRIVGQIFEIIDRRKRNVFWRENARQRSLCFFFSHFYYSTTAGARGLPVAPTTGSTLAKNRNS